MCEDSLKLLTEINNNTKEIKDYLRTILHLMENKHKFTEFPTFVILECFLSL